MLPKAVDPQIQAQRALGKVYALLCRLADEKENQKTADSSNFESVAALSISDQQNPYSQEVQQ